MNLDFARRARFEAALSADDYTGLIKLVRQFKGEGLSQVQVYDLFVQFMLHLRELGQESDEDRVMDVMDFIVGFCSPTMKLFPDDLSSEEIESYWRRDC